MMTSLLAFFETIPSSYRTAILVLGFVAFWLLESALPLFAFPYNKVKHAALNFFFTLTTLAVNFAFAFLLVKTCDFTSEAHFGLLYLTQLPLWLHIIAGLMLLDLVGAYLIHWIEHRVGWMWRFHLIHHSDTSVDVTTALRHHPGESVFRAMFTTLGVLILGLPVGVVMLYQTLSAIFGQITHANIQSPAGLDRLISTIFVTPNMHKVHHHYQQPLTDSNFGNIFSVWDRLFGTFTEVKHSNSLVYGIDSHMQPEQHSNLVQLLKIPFRGWRRDSNS